jgi:hypothetical protein
MRAKRLLTGELLGMTSKSEQDYLEAYSRERYIGKGKIIDLGCFLGATTIPLVKGLLKNEKIAESDKKVFAYDAFIWYEGMDDAVAGSTLSGNYRVGDSFLEEYKKRIQRYSDRIEIHEGNLSEARWAGGKIEFLLVDAMKNWDLTNAIFRNFYGSLIPNQAFVMQQDFAHYFVSWIHLLHWRFRDYFEFEAEIPASSSVVFKYVREIPEEQLQIKLGFENFSEDDIEKAFEYSANLVSDEKKSSIYASKVMCFLHQNRLHEAEVCFNKLISDGIKIEKHLAEVQKIIENRKA